MTGTGIEQAAATVGGSSSSLRLGLLLAAAAVILILLVWLLVRFLRTPRKKTEAAGLGERSLVRIWRRFLRSQPTAARPIVGRYPWTVVLGSSGSGKTQLIEARAGVQEYRHLGFPSIDSDPLLNIYLGRRGIVQEISAQLLSPLPGVRAALDALWRPLCKVQTPLIVLTFNLEELRSTKPEHLHELAHQLGERLHELGTLSRSPARLRVCLTYADVLLGEKEAAQTAEAAEPLVELTHGLRVPLVLGLKGLLGSSAPRRPSQAQASLLGASQLVSADLPIGALSAQFLKYAEHLRYALPRLSGGSFDRIVRCLADAPDTLRPLETLLTELVRPIQQVRSAGLESTLQLDGLYLIPRPLESPTASPRHVPGDNPFAVPGPRPQALTPELHKSGIRGLWPALRNSDILRTWHAALCAGLIVLGLIINAVVYFSHREAVQRLTAASEALSESVHKGGKGSGVTHDSLTIRRNAYQTGQQLRAIAMAERFWPLLPRVLAAKKRAERRKFLENVRNAYLAPALDARHASAMAFSGSLGRPGDTTTIDISIEAEEAMTRSLYALAAMNATRDNMLGELLHRNAPTWSSSLQIAESTLRDYTDFGEPDCNGMRLPSRPPRVERAQSGPLLLTNPRPWLEFARKLQRVAGLESQVPLDLGMLAELKQKAGELQKALQLVQRSRSLSTVADALEEECDVNVREKIGPLGWALLPKPWLVQNEEALTALVRLVLESYLELPNAEGLGMAEIADLLDALATKKARPNGERANESARLHIVRIKEERTNETIGISEPRWYDALVAVRKNYLLELLRGPAPKKPVSGVRGKPVLKGSPVPAWKKPLIAGPLPPQSAASGGRCGEPQTAPGLDVRYTRLGYERDVKPTLTGTDRALAAAQLAPADQTRIVNGVIEQARRYSARYRESLQQHFVSYGVRADSATALRAAVSEMLLPESSLFSHMRLVADNANLGELQGPYMQPFVENLAPFRPLIKLVTSKEGAFPELEPYRAILVQLAAALDSGGGSDTSTDTPLRDTLSGLGRLALVMLAEEESSPVLATQRWLDKLGVAPELRGPFLSPMRRALCLGTTEIERALQSRWRAVREAQVRPLYSRFPFDRAATEDVPIGSLDAIQPKDGTLWRFVRDDLSALVITQPDGRFTTKRLPGGSLPLPPDLLPTLNHLGALSRRLWDPKDGARRPLELRVRPQPLAGTVGPYAVTRAYLTVGSAAAVGYNQMPAERPLQVTWWNQENASVGIDLSTPDSPARHHASVDETRSAWSLLRLLARGTFASDNVVAFAIPVDLPNAKGSIEVRFVFTDLPFAPFKPPGAALQGGPK
jgi:hypothetical protein